MPCTSPHHDDGSTCRAAKRYIAVATADGAGEVAAGTHWVGRSGRGATEPERSRVVSLGSQ
jgi:hypothetical protein